MAGLLFVFWLTLLCGVQSQRIELLHLAHFEDIYPLKTGMSSHIYGNDTTNQRVI